MNGRTHKLQICIDEIAWGDFLDTRPSKHVHVIQKRCDISVTFLKSNIYNHVHVS